MKKIFTLFAAAVLSVMCMTLSAEVVTTEVAKQTADNFLALDNEWHGATDAEVRLVEHDGVPAYYVVEYTNGGWAVVSAQTSSQPVIGYNTTGVFAAPGAMGELLNFNAKMITARAKDGVEIEHRDWKRVMQRKPAADPETTPDIAPMISVNLNQSSPYNMYCPKIEGKNALVGCVAVAMTQAMMVQRYPERPVGQNTYKHQNMKLSIVYDDEPAYDWEAMHQCDQTKNYNEVARLLYHAGVSINMQYSLTFSGAYIEDAAKALVRNFQYDKTRVGAYARAQFTDEKWYDMIFTDLLNGRVVMYMGAADEEGRGGQSWNIDGWKQSTQMVHCNWGWGGTGDGYFSIDNMTDSYQGISFLFHHGAVFGVGKPSTAPYGINLSTTDFVLGTEAGVALADVIVSCEDAEAVYAYELKGPKNVTGKHAESPYQVVDGKLVSTKTIEDKNSFKYLLMTVTNTNTGESCQKEFAISIVADDAVESVMSDAMRVYPSVAADVVTIEVPAVGGSYAIYSVAGAQVQAGALNNYKNEVNVASLAAGTYILQYVHNSGVGVKTFIKK
ncbi:MAG: thiol protease/hemagglutinin PrtT [Bacteroidales bacterium]|nr:thiol protease/hemagglutinin PrtT [Bacteroidales bacterium]